jgi:hypothetical protein
VREPSFSEVAGGAAHAAGPSADGTRPGRVYLHMLGTTQSRPGLASLMWQAYFTPPVDDVQEITVATTRRVARHTLKREGEETIAWAQGDIATERWRRMSDDGNTETTVWLAPSLRYVPVKMRVVTNYKSLLGATLEATLDSIRVDEPLAQQ